MAKEFPRCPHGCYSPGGKAKSESCSVCTPATPREAPGTLTPTANGDPGRPSNRWQLSAPVKPEQLQTPAPVTNTAGVAPTVIRLRRRKGQYRPTVIPDAEKTPTASPDA